MKRQTRNIVGLIAGIILLVLAGSILWNHFMKREFQDLGDTEQKVLAEYNKYYKVASKEKQFDDFSLTGQTILILNGRLGEGYLINPKQHSSTLFSHRIKMPQGYEIRVSRVCWIYPQLLKLRFLPGNFNTEGADHRVMGNQVYFLRYDDKQSVSDKLSNMHFIRLLTHESFHYYIQKDWTEAKRCMGDMIRDEDIPLLAKKYEVLAEIQTELEKENPDDVQLGKLAQAYLENETARKEKNRELWEAEQSMETAEGTATYVSDKACQITGYDYPVYSFSKLIPLYEEGTVSKENLAGSVPYDAGALLCCLLDELEVKDWQERVAKQTKDTPVTLYDVLHDYIYEKNNKQ